MFSNLDNAWRPKDALDALKAVAKKHPAIAAVIEEHEKGKAPLPELRAASRKKGAPKLTELDAIAQKQLVEASKRYNGKKRTVKAILAGDDEDMEMIHPPTIERIRIVDAKGKPAYDAWLYNGDSGTVFRAGTTKVVAERIQAGLDSEDKQLRIALLAALDGKPKPKLASRTKK